MSTFKVTIALDNDAFAGEMCGTELARVLSRATAVIDGLSFDELTKMLPLVFRDINGNKVGTADIGE